MVSWIVQDGTSDVKKGVTRMAVVERGKQWKEEGK